MRRTSLETGNLLKDEAMPGRHRHILPPYMLTAMTLNGDAAQRSQALRMLSVDQTIRMVRLSVAVGPTALAARRRRAVASMPLVVKRTIRDAQNGTSLPGKVVRRREGEDATGDDAVDEAYEGLGRTFALYAEVYGRNSIDDAGLPLDATVHYDRNYDNAFWDGTQMVFGDGDGELFNRFTLSLDVIGHELTHGVTEKEAGLSYVNQSGALNEHLSDVFGSLVKQYALGQTAEEADWLIGAELLTKKVKGEALRSMKEPGTAYDDPMLGKDPQPGHMRDFVQTNQDNGGVHINSGIPNHAFYFAATSIGGHAWDGAGKIWYDALLDPDTRADTDFKGFAGTTIKVAGRLFGAGGAQEEAVRDAWQKVGVRLTSVSGGRGSGGKGSGGRSSPTRKPDKGGSGAGKGRTKKAPESKG